MGYQALIDSNLKKAFNLVKDLATTVTLTKKSVPSFNFATSETVHATSENLTVKAVIYNSKKVAKDKNVLVKELLLKSKDVGDISLYDNITINSQIWNIINVLKNDGFISVVEISKEV